MPKRPTTAVLVAWSVPFLIALLLIPESPRTLVSIKDHWLKAPTSTTLKVPSPTVRPTTPTPVLVAAAVKRTVPSGAPSSTPSASSASYAVTGAVTAPATRTGTLASPFDTAFEPLAVNTTWLISLDGPASTSLVCADSSTAVTNVVNVTSTGCSLELVAAPGSSVHYRLEQQ